jgi:DNA-binding NtrC family response regulator
MSIKEFTKILIVDDDRHIAEICSIFLKEEGWDVKIASTGSEAMDQIKNDELISIIYLDLNLPDCDGVELLGTLRRLNPFMDVIILTAYGTVESAVRTLKMGAIDFITKPFKKETIVTAANRVLQMRELKHEVSHLKRELKNIYSFQNIVGRSKKMQELFEKLIMASESDSTVLILGESGTGKELAARAIHYNGHRSKGPFIAVNCAALPRDLIESELFGYKKGAFTGAVRDSCGLFRAADTGTLFLDEITEMEHSTQSKLLRVIEDKRVRPLGGTEDINVDVRLLCATNKDIEIELSQGRLRKDLYYRVSVLRIDVPPLRERKEDIPLLIEHFIRKFNKDPRHRNIKRIDQRALDILTAYDWEGNVRELENVIQRAFVLGKGPTITVQDIPSYIVKSAKVYRPRRDFILSLDEVEKEAVKSALELTEGNKAETARLLKITRKRLYNLIKRHRLG